MCDIFRIDRQKRTSNKAQKKRLKRLWKQRRNVLSSKTLSLNFSIYRNQEPINVGENISSVRWYVYKSSETKCEPTPQISLHNFVTYTSWKKPALVAQLENWIYGWNDKWPSECFGNFDRFIKTNWLFDFPLDFS